MARKKKFKIGDVVREIVTYSDPIKRGPIVAIDKGAETVTIDCGHEDGWHDEDTGTEHAWMIDRYNAKLVEATEAPCVTERPVLGTQVGGSHYTACTIQPIEYIWANGLGFSEGNVIKYMTRWRAKGGIKDLKKAAHHVNLLIEWAEKEEAKGVKFGL